MKTSTTFASLIGLIMTTSMVSAFVVPTPTFQRAANVVVVVKADPKDQEEEGLDLNLEEMFDMFDAADKEENFDEAVKKVKGDK